MLASMSDIRRKSRNFRVEDSVWLAAKNKASQRGETLSEVIREYLRRYAQQPDKPKKMR